jgi:acyl dehydratase
MKRFAKLADLQPLVGQVIAQAPPVLVDQQRINLFAEATGDRQWIHVDPPRAAQGPFKSTIAHGFLTLSLLPELMASAFSIDDVRMGLNYGCNRLRFPSPVPAGSRLGAQFKLLAFQPIDGGAQLVIEATLACEGAGGAAKPACVVESVTRQYL